MNRTLIIIVLMAFQNYIHAQINEVGLFLGGSNYIGDIGPTDYLAPKDIAIGFVYKWNKSVRHSYRFSYTYGKLESHDRNSDVPLRIERDLAFDNTIHEFSAGLEFNFFEFDLHHLKPQYTPYIYTGLNYFAYYEKYFIGKDLKEDYREGAIAIPMIVGFKARLAQNFVIGIEAGARYTFTDNLDGSNPKNENLSELKFGNINSKDWYVFTGFTLTYTFGENPCFCPR